MISWYTLKKCRLEKCASDFEPYYYCQYVDDILLLFISPEDLEASRNFPNGGNVNISFTIEHES